MKPGILSIIASYPLSHWPSAYNRAYGINQVIKGLCKNEPGVLSFRSGGGIGPKALLSNPIKP